MKEKIDDLKQKIWITRKSRINAEKRLINQEKLIQYLNIWYAITLSGISLYSLVYDVGKNISIISVILSFGITISLIYFSNQNWSIRAENMKRNYINLQSIYLELDSEEDIDNKKLKEFQNKYIEILNSCENHKEIDYYEVMKDKDKKIYCKYIFLKIIRFLLITLCFLLPIIIIIFLRG